ncbi:MAG: urease accessory protein UreD [Pseudomonadota bacterium]
MLDTMTLSPTLQRAAGGAFVGLSSGDDSAKGASRLTTLRQTGCAKAFLPHVSGPPEVVFLNTAGGLTGGDVLTYGLSLGAGGRATATTQTAERAYAAIRAAHPARVDVDLEVGPGGRLDWLPQETILFQNARLDRHTRIALTGDAEVLICEMVVLGRAAMGERVDALSFFDRRAIARDDVPVFVDALEIDADVLAERGAAAGLAGAQAVAVVALVAPGAEDAVGALRGVSLPDGVRAGISGWDGRVVARLSAGDGWPLRLAVAEMLRHLRRGTDTSGALPRVWQI